MRHPPRIGLRSPKFVKMTSGIDIVDDRFGVFIRDVLLESDGFLRDTVSQCQTGELLFPPSQAQDPTRDLNYL